MQAAIEQILERETARGKALVARDFDLLASLLTEELVHIHSTGTVQDKRAYLEYVRGPMQFLSVERSDLKVKVLGDVAVMIGNMSNTMQPPQPAAPVTVESHVVQVWLRGPAGWQIDVFQATRLPVMDMLKPL